MLLYDLTIGFFQLAAVPCIRMGQFVKLENGRGVQFDFSVPGVNPGQRFLIAPDFLFITVLKVALAEDYGTHPLLLDFHAFNTVGGHGTFNQCVLREPLQPLRRLASKEILFASVLGQIIRSQTVAVGI